MINQATLLRAHYATEKDAVSPNRGLLHTVDIPRILKRRGYIAGNDYCKSLCLGVLKMDTPSCVAVAHKKQNSETTHRGLIHMEQNAYSGTAFQSLIRDEINESTTLLHRDRLVFVSNQTNKNLLR